LFLGQSIDEIPARYCLVDADKLLTSHNPLTGFGPRLGYPPGAQERDYQLQSERGKVQAIADKLRPALIFNTAPGALDGTPVVTENKVVLGGNGRTMALQLVYAGEGKTPPKAPKQFLLKHAKQFGFTQADIEKFARPVVVRTIRTGGDARNLAEWSRRLNSSLSQGLDSVQLAVSRARFLPPGVLDDLGQLGEEETLPQFLTSPRSLPLVRQLLQAGVIESRQAPQFINANTGLLNADGKSLLSDLLVAKMVPDAPTIKALGPGVVETIARAAPYLVATEAQGSFNLVPSLQDALTDRLQMRAQGFDSVAALERQGGLFGSSLRSQSPLTKRLLEILVELDGSPQKFAKLSKTYLGYARTGGSGQGGLFALDTLTPLDALNRSYQTATKRISYSLL